MDFVCWSAADPRLHFSIPMPSIPNLPQAMGLTVLFVVDIIKRMIYLPQAQFLEVMPAVAL
jgi:hypothetical protein